MARSPKAKIFTPSDELSLLRLADVSGQPAPHAPVTKPSKLAQPSKLAKPTKPAGGAAASDHAQLAMPTVLLYTDGACSGNPGPGGWAFVLKHPATGKQRVESGAELQTTNNRMELQAVISGLALLNKPTRVELTSDSQYVLKGLREWLKGWKAKGWKTASKQPVKNRDLWEELDRLSAMHQLQFHWIKGHSEHPENEQCDRLAVEAYRALQKQK